jgi:DNA-binding NtrC family response regulator
MKCNNHGNRLFPAEDAFHSSSETNPLDLREAGKKAAESAEKELIRKALHETRWNRKMAAGLLNISYKALLNKIQKYHLNHTVDLQSDGGGVG